MTAPSQPITRTRAISAWRPTFMRRAPLAYLVAFPLLGTAAWFFLLVNAFKVPFSVGLGLMTPESLLLNLLLIPALALGAIVGWRVARRISAAWFERIVLVLTLASGLFLLLRP